jgi:putative endopeptidase
MYNGQTDGETMIGRARVAGVVFTGLIGTAALAQQAAAPAEKPRETYKPTPSFDLSSIDAGRPLPGFLQVCLRKFRGEPSDSGRPGSDRRLLQLFNVNTQQLSGILEKAAVPSPSRTPNEQKIGDYYHACMDTDAIEQRGLEPLSPLLKEIDSMGTAQMAALAGKLQRMGVNVLFSYGEQQDFKDASKQIASIDQGGLGMPEKDFYLRTGAKDEQLRKDYVAYVAKMLTLSGVARSGGEGCGRRSWRSRPRWPRRAGCNERRDPEKTYHLVPVARSRRVFRRGIRRQFEDAIHRPM